MYYSISESNYEASASRSNAVPHLTVGALAPVVIAIYHTRVQGHKTADVAVAGTGTCLSASGTVSQEDSDIQ